MEMTTGVVKDDDDNNLLMDEDILENTKNSMFSHVRNGNLSYNNKSRSSTVTPLKEIAYFSQNQQRQCFLGGNSDLKSNGKNSILLEEMMGSITGTLNQSADCLTNSGNSFEILEDDKVLGNNTTPMMLEVKLQSPSLSESKFLNMNNSPTRLNNSNRYHYLKRKISKPNIIKHRPSRLDLLDSGLTSFPIDPPNLDSAEPNKDSDGALNGDGALHTNNDQDNSNLDTTHQSSIVLIEDYIEEKKTLNQNKSISILDFKKSIGEIEKKKQRNIIPSSSTLIKNFATSEKVPQLENFMINDSPVSLAGNFFSKNIKTKQDFPLRHCCLCEVPLYEISTLIPSSTSKLNNDNRYKELVCSKCTETYEKLIHLINNLQIQENNLSTWNNKEDNGDEIYEELESSFNSLSFHLKKSDQFQNCDIEPSFKKQCNSLEREIFENSQINNISNTNGLDKLYCDLKKIQDHNNYLLNKLKKPTAKRKNPLLRRIKQDVYNANNNANNNNNNNNNNNESATFKFNFNFNDNNNIFKNSPVSNNYNYQPHINFVPNGVINHNNDMNNNTLKSSNSTLSFNFIRDGMSTYASVDTKDIWSSLNNTAKDLWIKARRRFNYFRQTYNNNNNDNERDDMIKVSSGDDSEEEEYYRHAQ